MVMALPAAPNFLPTKEQLSDPIFQGWMNKAIKQFVEHPAARKSIALRWMVILPALQRTTMADESTQAVLEIRRNADGAVRRDPELWDYFDDFIWSEGNFACDCNRHLFWHRAANEPESDDNPCGDSKYSVRLTGVDGAILYDEFGNSR